MSSVEKIIKNYTGKATISNGFKNTKIETVSISNNFAKLEISLYGAHILSFKPNGNEELLWMSEKSFFTEGKAIRGGIPLCFPWFGPNTNNVSLPQHGFARLCIWELEEISDLPDDSTKVVLALSNNDFTEHIWPYKFSAKLIVIIGNSLNVSLYYKNTGNNVFTCTDALHTYFKISNIEDIHIEGLKNTAYYQGFDDIELVQKKNFLTFKHEENRRFVNHTGECLIVDKEFKRKIKVAKTGSKVTVVWNPWSTSVNMADFATNGYKTMVCVEAANTYTDIIRLKPNEEFSISTVISCEPI